MEDKLITILHFENPMDADLTKTLLENNGINSYIADDILSTINPFYITAIGRIKLQINIQDREKALIILKDNNFDFKVHGKYDNIKAEPCKKCNSRKVYPDKPRLYFIILSAIFLFIPLIIKKRHWRCYDCNFSWIEPITFNKIFFSVLILPILFILWANIYSKVEDYIVNYDVRIINEYKDDIYKLELTNKIGTDKHLVLINKIIDIYNKNNNRDSAIDFLNDQVALLKDNDKDQMPIGLKVQEMLDNIIKKKLKDEYQ